jgi:hypothetical protein
MKTLVISSLVTFRDLTKRLDSIGVFSDNETLEDVSTGDLVYMLAPFAFSEVLGRLKTTEREERMAVIREAGVRLSSAAYVYNNLIMSIRFRAQC